MSKTVLLTITCLLIICVIVIINKKRSRTKNFNRKQVLIIIGVLIIISMISVFISGYRISPLAASRANGFIKEDFELINDLDLDWAYIHFYHDKENDKYYTAISEKKLFMYVSRCSVWHYSNNEDPIRTIGSMNYNNGKGKFAKLLMVDTDDKNIESIIIRDEHESIETKINVDSPQIIIFDKFLNLNDCDVVALDENNQEIFYYGYPRGTNILRDEDYKWHYVEDVVEGQN
ncbi:hypothetical protein [Oceanirhabdus seepicola]|uniref:Uncharacterized protein n=1 Tax=Oceanirhabdus seepicola TaxID=2828781 RepID=A0A9J6P661_9CLOT|nr:hypothetical protein [Oceanirhabdus seepicola]MCM1991277.1 hypothetical protein [Oceanirhabdus seepicola]